MNFKLIVACTFLGLTSAFAGPPPISQELDTLVQAQADKHQVAGFSVSVAWHGKMLLNKGYGFSNLAAKTAADGKTLYSIGSMTKQFTAVAILQLAQKGKLSLDEDIHDLVPEYPAHQPAETIRSLLSHTSGIPDYFPTEDADQALVFKPISENDMIARFAQTPLDFPPGSNFAYSNSNFYLLGIAIERLTGERYNDYLRDHIFRPHDLDISECGTSRARSRMSQGYLPNQDGNLTPSPDMNMDWAFAAGNLCATAQAIVKWNTLLHRGHILADWTYAEMTTPIIMSDGTPTTYGAGLFIDHFEGQPHFEHGGDTVTFSSQEAYYPNEDLSIVILTNTESRFDRFGLERDLGRAVLGLPSSTLATVPLPGDLPAKIVGNYDVLGRTLLGTNPSVIEVTDNQASLSLSGITVPMTYEGDGRFGIGSPEEDNSLLFPMADGVEPFFSVYIHEMLLGRGMRNTSSEEITIKRLAKLRSLLSPALKF